MLKRRTMRFISLFLLATFLSIEAFSTINTIQPTRTGSALRDVDSSIGANVHRHSASDWLYNVQSFPQSQILREIASPVTAVGIWASALSLVHRILQHQLPSTSQILCISPHAHSFVVSALGLLLVFRTNSAYQRFYEGRKIWESILSLSRNLSRMVLLYERDIGVPRKLRLLQLIAAYPYLLRMHIRPQCLCDSDQEQDIEPKARLELELPRPRLETRQDCVHSIKDKKQPDHSVPDRLRCFVDKRRVPWNLFARTDLPNIAQANNKPLWVTDRMALEVAQVPYGPNFTSRERLSMISLIDKLTDTIGQCERIHQTAVPLNYARHSLRSLTFWLFTLPFALVKDLGLLTGPATACIAWLLYGIYQIGYQIEDPFQRSLRLSILCDAIREDVLGRASTSSLPMAEEEQLLLERAESSQELLAPSLFSMDKAIVDTILNHTSVDAGFQ